MIDTRSLAGAVNKYKFVAIGLIVSIHKAVFDVVLGSPFNLWGLPRTENYIKDGFLFFISHGWLCEMNYDEAELLEELDEQLEDYKRESKFRLLLSNVSLSYDQYHRIYEQRYKTPDTRRFSNERGDVFASGEHFVLISVLENVLKIRVATSSEALDLADEVIDRCYPQN